MNANEFKAQERGGERCKVWAVGLDAETRRIGANEVAFEPAPRSELEAVQHSNALANTGNYPVGTSECFNVGIAGGCGRIVLCIGKANAKSRKKCCLDSTRTA